LKTIGYAGIGYVIFLIISSVTTAFGWIPMMFGIALIILFTVIASIGFGAYFLLLKRTGFSLLAPVNVGIGKTEAREIAKRKCFQIGLLVQEILSERLIYKGRITEDSKPTRLHVMIFREYYSQKKYFAVMNVEEDVRVVLDDRNKPEDLLEFDGAILRVKDVAIEEYTTKEQFDRTVEDMARDKTMIEEIEETKPSGEKIIKRKKSLEQARAEVKEEGF